MPLLTRFRCYLIRFIAGELSVVLNVEVCGSLNVTNAGIVHNIESLQFSSPASR